MDGEKLNLEGKHANSWITIRPRGSDFTNKFGAKEVATDQKSLEFCVEVKILIATEALDYNALIIAPERNRFWSVGERR